MDTDNIQPNAVAGGKYTSNGKKIQCALKTEDVVQDSATTLTVSDAHHE